jgi:hemolysin III
MLSMRAAEGRMPRRHPIVCWSDCVAVAILAKVALCPRQSLGFLVDGTERLADLCVLLTGLILGAAGAAALFVAALAARDDSRLVVAVGVYAVILPVTFLCALFYAAALGTPWRGPFRRLDHAAIWALIAATATPIAIARPAGDHGLGVAVFIWVIAATGIFIKLRFRLAPARRSAVVFGLSAWAVMAALGPTVASRRALLLIVLGGVLYTVGTAFHLRRDLRFHRAIWHGFVIAGALAHYLAIVAIVL